MSQIQIDLDQITYRFICRLAERTVEAGGLIFGGFLRDKLIREANPKVMPQNLDVVFHGNPEELQMFLRDVARDDVDFKAETDNRPHPLFLKGVRRSIEWTLKNSDQILGRPIKVQMDLFCSPQPVALTRISQDLECNLLICDSDGVRTCTDPEVDESVFEQFTRQQELISRIIAQTTRVIPSSQEVNRTRIQSGVKMMLRGWTIDNISSFSLAEPHPGVCLFCQDQIAEEGLRLNCCMKHTHSDCLLRFLKEPDRCFFSKTGCRHDICLELTD